MPDTNYSDDFLEIGRIPNMRSDIDPEGVISNYLKSKMSVIDLIPCLFTVPYSNILSATEMTNTAPTLKYEGAINSFRQICLGYGLKQYSFLRLYLTDMTSSTDEMSNEYTKNIIDDTLNNATMQRLMSPFVQVNKISESTGSNKPSVSKTADELSKNYFNIDISQTAIDKMDLAQSILTHGSRISFPKIWSNSSYSPNLQCVIKLVSPYGHPKAIHEFIIKPLSYILILLSPTTKQGLTTEKPSYLTMKSYGLSNLSLCYPGQLQIRRGGDDSNYNKFKQPMVVEVALTFQAVTEGFACYASVDDNPEAGIFSSGSEIALQSFEKEFTSPSSLFPTLKSIVNSFRPFGYEATTSPLGLSGGTSPTTQSGVSTGGGTNNIDNVSPLPSDLNTLSSNPPVVNDSYESAPNALYLTSGDLVFTTPDTSAPFEIEIVNNTTTASSTEYDPTNFESDENFESIETDEDAQKHTLTMSSSLSSPSNTIILRIRNLPPESSTLTSPGMWSESVTIGTSTSEEVESPLVRVTPSVLPLYSIYTDDARLMLESESGEIFGPLVGGDLDLYPGTYTIRIEDLAANSLNEEESITVLENTESIESYLDIEEGSLNVLFNIPSFIDIDDITFLLISDFNESNINEFKNNEVIENLYVGKYYISVKYNGISLQFDTGVNNYIDIVDDTLKVLSIDINNDLKIISVSEVS